MVMQINQLWEGETKSGGGGFEKGQVNTRQYIHMSPVKATDVHMRGGPEKQMEREREREEE